MPHTHTQLVRDGREREREGNEEFHAMSGDPLTKNPHKNICGCRDRIPFTASKFARLSGSSQRESCSLYFYYYTKETSPSYGASHLGGDLRAMGCLALRN
jgi:hypothetical protein